MLLIPSNPATHPGGQDICVIVRAYPGESPDVTESDTRLGQWDAAEKCWNVIDDGEDFESWLQAFDCYWQEIDELQLMGYCGGAS